MPTSGDCNAIKKHDILQLTINKLNGTHAVMSTGCRKFRTTIYESRSLGMQYSIFISYS